MTIKSWISFPTTHPHDPELDTDVHVNPDNIAYVMKATSQDRKQRKEVNSVVVTPNGIFATTDTCDELMTKIAESDSDLPS